MSENILTAEEKAWACVKQALNDDLKYDALRYKQEPIELNGSEGGRYILYPNGHVIDLQKDVPKLGKVEKSIVAPYPDVLATTIAWIIHDEDKFKKNWGCGSIRVKENEETTTEHEVSYHYHHYQSHWYDDIHPFGRRHQKRNILMLYMLLFLGVWYFSPQTFSSILPPLTSLLNSTQTNATLSSNNTSTQATNESTIPSKTSIQVEPSFLIVIIVLALFGMVVLTKDGRRWLD